MLALFEPAGGLKQRPRASGLEVVFNLLAASLTMLGLVLAVATVAEGLVMTMVGRQLVALAPRSPGLTW
jgi:hypothetical protein